MKILKNWSHIPFGGGGAIAKLTKKNQFSFATF